MTAVLGHLIGGWTAAERAAVRDPGRAAAGPAGDVRASVTWNDLAAVIELAARPARRARKRDRP